MDSGELYQKKYQYERFIRKLNDSYSKLGTCYSNLLSCKKKIGNCILINGKYYSSSEFQKIIDNVSNYRDKIAYTILPQARYEYNKILSQISELG